MENLVSREGDKVWLWVPLPHGQGERRLRVDEDALPLLERAKKWRVTPLGFVVARRLDDVPRDPPVILGRHLLDSTPDVHTAVIHRNGDKDDFRRSNLVLVWKGVLHLRDGGSPRRDRRGHDNVVFLRSKQLYSVRFRVNGKDRCYGTYEWLEDAERRVEEVRQKLRDGVPVESRRRGER